MKMWISMSVYSVMICSSVGWAADKPKDFSGQELTGGNFAKQRLEKANFEDAVLKQANFNEAVLTGANFQGVDLTNAEMKQAEMTGADFRGAILENTALFQAVLNEANLEKVDLSKVPLSGTKFRKANLRKLKGIGSVAFVDFSGADLRGADLVGMTIYSNTAMFRKAKYDSQTKWPKGFDVEASGAVLVVEEDEKPESEPKKPVGNPGTKNLQQEFAKLDLNEDGRLSGKEMRGLEELDKNKDGRVTLEEYVAGKQKE